MNLQPGDLVSFEKDGEIFTDRVASISYRSGSPAVYRHLNRWQRLIRQLTPPRWRPSLLVRAATLPSVTMETQ